jgi:hypothetical protein
LVFARGRSAIEALGVGAAVILCDAGLLGPMVTSQNFAQLRRMNFALRALDQPLTEERVAREIGRYDANDAAAVSRMAREQCEIQPAADSILAIYQSVIEEARNAGPVCPCEAGRALAAYLEKSAPHYKASMLAEHQRYWSECVDNVRRELDAIRSSATWRWSRQVLGNPVIERLFGGVIRRVANSRD